MLVIPEIVRIVRKNPALPVAPATPTLVSATYESTTAVTLVFDRAVDASAMTGDAVTVRDGEEQCGLRGEPLVETLSPTTVRVLLYIDESDDPGGVTLSVAANNGLVGVGGGAWGGCSDLALPFGG